MNISIVQKWSILLQFILHFFIRMMKQYKMIKVSYLWRLKNKHNKTTVANPISQVLFPLQKVTVGKNTYGGLHVIPYNETDGNLMIGSFCSIAKDVKFLLGGNHDYQRFSTYPFRLITDWEGSSFSKGDIVIGDDVWICENSLILSGNKIGQGAIIAANTVVTRDVKPYEIVGGNPMRHIKYRFSEENITKLLNINFENIDINVIDQNKDIFKMHIDDNNIDLFLSRILEKNKS
ncbi:MAG: CatB-related O-acetyltransferase [Bacteroidales bacterium]|nr:CatB-related O-acetyltransferase [Bacteroidales bacterium]